MCICVIAAAFVWLLSTLPLPVGGRGTAPSHTYDGHRTQGFYALWNKSRDKGNHRRQFTLVKWVTEIKQTLKGNLMSALKIKNQDVVQQKQRQSMDSIQWKGNIRKREKCIQKSSLITHSGSQPSLCILCCSGHCNQHISCSVISFLSFKLRTHYSSNTGHFYPRCIQQWLYLWCAHI